MADYLTATASVCRVCRRPLSAQILAENGSVWMVKHCPEHGPQKARIHGDPEAYARLNRFHRRASMPAAFATAAAGCPDSCGLCPEHEQHVCLPILEITDHCNWDCPICLVQNPGTSHRTRAEVAAILDGLIRSEGQIDVLNLSGGEPTMNPFFREIIDECTRRPEVLRVSVSTNGSTLARDPDLLPFLAERKVIVSLQFDGLEEEFYVKLRGRPALREKLALIERCAQLGVAMSLTATVVRGVNDQHLSPIADLLFAHDHILSAMFQPAAYAGNAAPLGRPDTAVTIPDVIAALEGAGGGTVGPDDFSPLPCSHPACFALAFYPRIGAGRFRSMKSMVQTDRYLALLQNRAIFGTDPDSFAQVTDAVYDLWSGPSAQTAEAQATLRTVRQLLAAATAGGYSPQRAMKVAERSVKSIFIHQFMDPDTFDLSRARKCCQVYPQPDGRLIPACVYNCLKRGREDPSRAPQPQPRASSDSPTPGAHPHPRP